MHEFPIETLEAGKEEAKQRQPKKEDDLPSGLP